MLHPVVARLTATIRRFRPECAEITDFATADAAETAALRLATDLSETGVPFRECHGVSVAAQQVTLAIVSELGAARYYERAERELDAFDHRWPSTPAALSALVAAVERAMPSDSELVFEAAGCDLTTERGRDRARARLDTAARDQVEYAARCRRHAGSLLSRAEHAAAAVAFRKANAADDYAECCRRLSAAIRGLDAAPESDPDPTPDPTRPFPAPTRLPNTKELVQQAHAGFSRWDVRADAVATVPPPARRVPASEDCVECGLSLAVAESCLCGVDPAPHFEEPAPDPDLERVIDRQTRETRGHQERAALTLAVVHRASKIALLLRHDRAVVAARSKMMAPRGYTAAAERVLSTRLSERGAAVLDTLRDGAAYAGYCHARHGGLRAVTGSAT